MKTSWNSSLTNRTEERYKENMGLGDIRKKRLKLGIKNQVNYPPFVKGERKKRARAKQIQQECFQDWSSVGNSSSKTSSTVHWCNKPGVDRLHLSFWQPKQRQKEEQ